MGDKSQEDEDDDVLGEPEDDEDCDASPSTSSPLPIPSFIVTVVIPGFAVSNGAPTPISMTAAISGSIRHQLWRTPSKHHTPTRKHN